MIYKDETISYPSRRHKRKWINKWRKEHKKLSKGKGYFHKCLYCKKKFAKQLEPITATPFIVSQKVQQATKDFTQVEEPWLFGKEDKNEYIERVCTIMGACK